MRRATVPWPTTVCGTHIDHEIIYTSGPYERVMTNLLLYELSGCPYCAKVKEKLADLDLEYDSIMVPGPHDERTEVEEVSGQTGVPVLVDEANGIDWMSESDDIVEYLDQTYGNAS